LVAHAKAATRHFRTGTGLTKDIAIALFNQLRFVHLGRRSNPKACRDGLLQFVEQLSGGAKVPNVGHA
jgi:hypothetical protein